MASYIKKIKLGTTIYEVRDSSAVHSGDTNVNISITGSAGSANTANSATTAGTADVANKLGTTTVGGSTQPVYLNNGVPTAIGYTIATNVPSGAQFTDTVVTVNDTLTSTSTSEALSANQGRVLSVNKANLASPAFTGTPTAPTASAGTNNTQIATTAFVQTAVSSASGGTSIAISSSQPSGQKSGDLWYKIV